MTTYGLNARHEDVQLLQRYLNEKLSLDLKPDGHLGKITQAALKVLQDKLGVVDTDANGACYGTVTQAKISAEINAKYLRESNYVAAAQKAQIETNVVKTVTRVEAKQFGFANDGSIVALFERHIFYRQLKVKKGEAFARATMIKYPDICNTTTGGYVGGKAELKRLDKAKAIDEECALLSASYGLFQIMGFNFKQAGFNSVQGYYSAVCKSEAYQLDAFINYLLLDTDKSMLNALRKKDFTSFAKEYNGPGYRNHSEPYDDKMRRIYAELNK